MEGVRLTTSNIPRCSQKSKWNHGFPAEYRYTAKQSNTQPTTAEF
jgi:hypothetical protein